MITMTTPVYEVEEQEQNLPVSCETCGATLFITSYELSYCSHCDKSYPTSGDV